MVIAIVISILAGAAGMWYFIKRGWIPSPR